MASSSSPVRVAPMQTTSVKVLTTAQTINVTPRLEIKLSINSLYCGICSELYNISPQPGHDDKFPEIFCSNSHTFCKLCCSQLELCPTCQGQRIAKITDVSEKQLEQSKMSQFDDIPMISFGEIHLVETEPAACGSSADVFRCEWNGNLVALKTLRMKFKPVEQELIQLEATAGFNLRHPNIIQMFGLTKLKNNHLGIIMEWADQGSLNDHITDLNEVQKIQVGICISRGLKYLHGLDVAHRDLKPQNILLFGEKTFAKISDFGTSKAAQNILAFSSSIVGTPKYAAPEMMHRGSLRCGKSVDIYSLSVILFELFSGLDPFPGSSWDVIFSKMSGKRPEIPANFPNLLRSVTDRGMSGNVSERPSIAEFLKALKDLQDFPQDGEILAVANQISASLILSEETRDTTMLVEEEMPPTQDSSDDVSSGGFLDSMRILGQALRQSEGHYDQFD